MRLFRLARVSLFVPYDAKPIACSGSIVRCLSGNRVGIHLSALTVAQGSGLDDLLLPIIQQEEKAAAEPDLSRRDV